MKNMKLLIFFGLMLESIIGASDRGWIVKYQPVEFAFPLDHDEDGIEYPADKLSPSKVGFYNGDMNEYVDNIQQTYPADSCLQERTISGTWLDAPDGTKIIETRDWSGQEQFEHCIQDAVMQQTISNNLGSIESLSSKRNRAEKSKDFYQNIVYFGLNCFWRKANLSQLSSELLTKKVYNVRAKEYVKYKNSPTVSGFQYARNQFVLDMNSKNFPDDGLKFTQEKLENVYKEMSTKVLLDHQTQILNKEKRFYQGCIAVTVTALSVGGYFWATKK